MRKALLCLIVLMASPVLAASPETAAPLTTQTQTLADAQFLASVNVNDPGTGAVAAIRCSGSCGGGPTWTWTCPSGYECFLNCAKNPPAYCYKPTTPVLIGAEATHTADNAN